MSTSQPGLGETEVGGSVGSVISPASIVSQHDGDWREGLRVRIAAEPGVTPTALMKKGEAFDTPFRFQFPPLETWTLTGGYDHAEYQTINKGTFSRPQGRQLRQVTFSTLFLDYEPSYVAWEDGDPDPTDAWRRLQDIMLSGAPFNLLVWEYDPAVDANADSLTFHPTSRAAKALRSRPELDMIATLRSMTVNNKAGEPEARYVDVTFSEWRNAELARASKTKKKRKKAPKHPRLPAKHTVKDGDTLTAISRHYYGESTRWRVLQRVNGLEDWPPSKDLALRKPRVRTLTIPATVHI